MKKMRNLFIYSMTIISLLLFSTQVFAEDQLTTQQSIPKFKEIPIKFAKMRKDQVPLRMEPTLNSAIIERLKLDIYLRILKDEGAFYQVWLPVSEQQAYVSKNDITVIDPQIYDTIIFHQVRAGDTLWTIADSYKTSLKATVEINHLNPNRDIFVGQTLIIPKGTPDTVDVIKTNKIPVGFDPVNKTINKYNAVDIKNHWAYTQLDDFLNAEILKGIENQGVITLKPEKKITRAEFVAIIIRALGLENVQSPITKNFIDVKPEDWSYNYIQIATAKGMVNGIDEKHFAPDQLIRRDEIAAIVTRAFDINFNAGTPKSFNDVQNDWAKPFIDEASSVGIITGVTNNNFKPKKHANRAEAVTMVYRALQLENSDLPLEDQLIEQVTHELSDIDWYIQYGDSKPWANKSYELLKNFIKTNTTGYYQMYLYQQVKNLEILQQKNNIVPMITLRGPRIVHVIHRSNRFASVEIKGANYDVTLKGWIAGLDQNRDFPLDASGILLLKKTSDGTWKSYMFIPKASSSSHLIEGIVKQSEKILKKL